jgi:hypothetical protein
MFPMVVIIGQRTFYKDNRFEITLKESFQILFS